eukprot:SAG22_NODE_10567_length_527_cov_1.264019_1_plen_87_part_10
MPPPPPPPPPPLPVCVCLSACLPASDLSGSVRTGDLLLKRPHPVVSAVPEITKHALLPGDDDSFIILDSDGLWDVLDDQKAVDIVAT